MTFFSFLGHVMVFVWEGGLKMLRTPDIWCLCMSVVYMFILYMRRFDNCSCKPVFPL